MRKHTLQFLNMVTILLILYLIMVVLPVFAGSSDTWESCCSSGCDYSPGQAVYTGGGIYYCCSNGWQKSSCPTTTTTSTTTTSTTTSTTTTTIPACSGSISLSLSPNPTSPSSTVTANADNLSNCNGKTIYIKDYNGCASGSTICSCTSSSTGCSCNFTAPSSPGNYDYYACIDKNGDGDFADAGEQSSKVTLNVTSSTTSTTTSTTTTTLRTTTTTTTSTTTTSTTTSTTTTTLRTTTTTTTSTTTTSTIPPTTTTTLPPCSCDQCGYYLSSNCNYACNEWQNCVQSTCSASGCISNPYCYKCEWKSCNQTSPKVYILTPFIVSGGNLTVSVYFECSQWSSLAKNLTLSLKIDNQDWNECFLNNKGLMTDFGWNSNCDMTIIMDGNCGSNFQWSCSQGTCYRTYNSWPIWTKSNFNSNSMNVTFTCKLPYLSGGSHSLTVIAKVYESEVTLKPSVITFRVGETDGRKILEFLLFPVKVLRKLLPF